MSGGGLENPNPTVFEPETTTRASPVAAPADDSDAQWEPLDALEVFDLIRHIKDPEHPNTLEQLKVTTIQGITVDDAKGLVTVLFTPTIPHCSMSTLIGLSIRVQLLRCLPSWFKVDVRIAPGTHDQEAGINKQLCDKERVAAALENTQLLSVVNGCLYGLQPSGRSH
eukprot:RCo023585